MVNGVIWFNEENHLAFEGDEIENQNDYGLETRPEESMICNKRIKNISNSGSDLMSCHCIRKRLHGASDEKP